MRAFRYLVAVCLCMGLLQSATFAEMSGKAGIVVERTKAGKLAGPIAKAAIVFTSEDGKFVKNAVSGPSGRYRIALPEGRYKVSVSHPKFEPYSTGGGFSVVSGGRVSTHNIFLRPRGMPPVE